MPPTDSYDALAASIERALRHGNSEDAEAGLSAAIQRALLEEARLGELSIAIFRLPVVVVCGLLSVALVALGAAGSTIAGVAITALVWGLWSIVLLVALRRGWYRLWLRHGLPIADAIMIASVIAFATRAAALGEAPIAGIFGFVVALCGFLAGSGGPRLSRSSAQLSGALALAIALVASRALGVNIFIAVLTAALLAVTGLLVGRAPTLIRRLVMHGIGQMEMTRRYEEAQAAVGAREEALKIVSHDLRNPLSTIAMAASLMLDEELTPAMRSRQLQMIKRAGERMNRLVQDLLEVAKLEAGRLALKTQRVEVHSIIAEAQDTLGPIARAKSIELSSDVAPNAGVVEADPGRVQQVLSNLVGNAVKFTPAGGRIQIRVEPADGAVRFSVSDTGPGIPSDRLEQVFGRFWQADRTDRRGLGLGLAIAKAIVDGHGGRIWVESQVGKGTTFYFTLPSAAT
jgi:signal transduction histidine kinase